jgi:integrase/transposase-like protein
MTNAEQELCCPQCGSAKLWRDGLRYTGFGQVQRFVCRNCGYRFSDPESQQLRKKHIWTQIEGPRTVARTQTQRDFNAVSILEHVERILTKPLKSKPDIPFTRQICVNRTKGAKNLAAAENQTQAAGITPQDNPDLKGNIINFLWWMEKQGYACQSIRGAGSALRALLARGANLGDPETVKEALAREQKWSQARRRNVINTYTVFLKFEGLQWEKPKCNVTRKFPFIPTEQEIDALIAACPTTVSAFLQLLKETAMRSGEAKKLLWTDIDFERRTIVLNEPEKNSLPRIWNPSPKLLSMLNVLQRKSLKVFGDGPINSMKTTFIKARRRLAIKLQNPRLFQIHFHTLRHWKATMEYHRTKDLLHVMAFLGHKKSDNTLIYVQLDEKLFKDWDDNFITKIAHNVREACALIETGFDYVTGEYNDGGKIFRKRK